jgi:hypothetical protein
MLCGGIFRVSTTVFVLLNWAMSAAFSIATPILDQSFEPSEVSMRGAPEGVFQSFTSGLNGQLWQIDLLLSVVDGGDRDVIVNLWDANLKTLLGNTEISPSLLPPNNPPNNNVFISFDFSEKNIFVAEGVSYVEPVPLANSPLVEAATHFS